MRELYESLKDAQADAEQLGRRINAEYTRRLDETDEPETSQVMRALKTARNLSTIASGILSTAMCCLSDALAVDGPGETGRPYDRKIPLQDAAE